MRKTRWGVLGYARIARTCLIPALREHEGSVLYALATRTPESAEIAGRESGFEKVYVGYDALLDDPDVEVVYIPLPNSLHKEWAIKAMLKGKNVLCEKPMALDEADALLMTETARRCDVLLMEAFMYRFTDRYMRLRAILDEGLIGDVRSVSSSWRFLLNRVNTIKERPELGGGSLYDVGCYPVSLVNDIMGDLPAEVHTVRNINENGVDVSIQAIMKYSDGRMARIDAGFDSNSAKCTEISGTKGSIIVPETFIDSSLPIIVSVMGEPEPRLIAVNDRNRYLNEVRAVYDAVVAGKKEILSLEDSVRNARLLKMILSAET